LASGLKLPGPLVLKLTVPVGAVAPVVAVSVTVAVQVVDWPATTGCGEQLTEVLVGCNVIFRCTVKLGSWEGVVLLGQRTALVAPPESAIAISHSPGFAGVGMTVAWSTDGVGVEVPSE
jgi:hypothetical protein